MNRNAALAALFVALLGGGLLVLYMRRFEAERSGGEPVKVLVVTKAVARGKALTESVLAVREIPSAYVDDRSVKAAERDKVIGLHTVAPLRAQNVVMWNDLAVSAEEHRDLSSLVTPGFRAVYIRAIREDQGSPLINPGDYVDVIATFPRGEGRAGDRETSVVLLQRVLVLASGGKMSADDGTAARDAHTPPPRDQGLTLSLSLPQAQLIALASRSGQFSVALRNPDDPRTLDGIPDLQETVLTSGTLSAPTTGAVASRPAGPIKLRDIAVGAAAAP
ncbi:MAG: Flp pilus assembly protein CpaB [Polyangiaceae bacterium]|nr:Flp pilus assembly protein CpaB [Polyangiaceae bacterium]